MSRLPRHSNPAELQAFDTVCERLAGFDGRISCEFVDGFLAALAAGPTLPTPEQWLPALCDDAFERAFADPQDHAQALRALRTRLVVLLDQIDPDVLLDDAQALRLEPLMAEWDDAGRQQVMQEEGLSQAEVAQLQTGAVWAEGFMAAVRHFAALWPDPAADDASAALYVDLLRHVGALQLVPGSAEWAAHAAAFHPGGEPTRDELISEACYAAQDLRLWWFDHAPRPETRRVEAQPGRNDPCPCGSGKKFKKCHGAGA